MEDILHIFNPWWEKEYEFPGIEREKILSKLINQKELKDITLITGLRRIGKTTVMHQMIYHLLKNVSRKRIFYVSLDNYSLRDYNIIEIVREYRKIQKLKNDEYVYLFLDEIHTKENYEIQLKNLYDMGHNKIYASGSSALEITMKSPHLTGRHRIIPMGPLDFKEYLKFKDEVISPADSYLYPEKAEEYAVCGGILEYVKTGDPNYIQSLIDTIIRRDIAGVHSIQRPEKLIDTLIFIARGIGAPLSVRKISCALGISKDEISRYIELFREANLIFIVEKDGKLSERKASPRKVYLTDTGLISVLTGTINMGCLIENAVFLSLLKRGDVRYFKHSGREIDFIVNGEAWESKYKDNIESSIISSLKLEDEFQGHHLITKNREGNVDGVELKPFFKLILDVSE